MTTTTASGLPVQRWATLLQDCPTARLPVLRGGSVWVVAAHPDDETLGLAGTMRRLLLQGCSVRLVVATDGEAAYGHGVRSPALARTRRAELRQAMATLGLTSEPVLPGLPDGRLAEHRDELGRVLHEVGPPPDLVLAPWTADPHPDHRAAGDCALAYATNVGRPLWQYPIWMRHWTDPDTADIAGDRLQVVRLSMAEQAHKDAALACHTSQVTAQHGQQPVLPDYVLAHFADKIEPLFAPAVR